MSYTVPRFSRLSPEVHTRIPVSDKVYEYLSATLLPSKVCNLEYSGLSHGMYTGILVSNKVYMKTCKLRCSLVYQSISQCIGACHLKCKPVNISQRQSILRDPILQNILGDRLLYPGLLTDTLGTSVADRSSYTLIVADRYSSISIHSKCISQVTD